MRKIKFGGPAYQARLGQLARQWLNVKDCRECGSPQRDGWVCVFCGQAES